MKCKSLNGKVNRLGMLMGLGGLNGSVAIAALEGLFTLKNVPMLALAFMVGPGAILAAALIDDSSRARMFVALLAGIFSTILIVAAAGIGPKLLGLVNVSVLKVVGGASVVLIGLLIAGFKIPENVPSIVMVFGIIASFIWR